MEQRNIDYQQRLLVSHRRRLATLLEQLALWGNLYAPAHLIIEIEDTRTALAHRKAVLRSRGVAIEDLPDDVNPSVALPSPQVQESIVWDDFSPSNKPFVGRSKCITTIVEQLTNAIHAATPIEIGIHGLGGVGKTTFAHHLSCELQARFPDAQIAIRLQGSGESDQSVAQALGTIIHRFKPDCTLPDDLRSVEGIYRSLLRGKRVLILADDMPSLKHLRSLQPPAGCALIFTSHRRFVTNEHITWVKLEPLPKRDSISLLRTICPRMSKPEAVQIADLCGNLPLALCLCAARLDADDGWPIARYIAKLADEINRLKLLYNPDLSDKREENVAAAFNLSYQALTPEAQAILHQFIVFAAPFDTEALESIVVLPDEADRDEAVSLLRRSSLLARADKDRYTMHNLVRSFAFDQPTFDAVRPRYARYYATLTQRAHTELDQGDLARNRALKQLHQNWPHIDAGWTWACGKIDQADSADLLLSYAAATLPVFDRLCARDKRLALLEPIPALAACAGNCTLQTAALIACGDATLPQNNSASLAHERNRAYQYYSEALSIAPDQHSEARAYIGLGIVNARTGDLEAAISSYLRGRSLARDSGDQHTYCLAQSNLGNAFIQRGRLNDAIAGYWKALELASQLDDRRIEVKLWRDLGAAATAMAVAADPTHDDQHRVYLQWAAEYYERSRLLARQIGDEVGAYDTRCHKSNLDRLVRQWHEPHASNAAHAA